MPSKDHGAFRRAVAASAAQPELIEVGKRIDELCRELGGQRAAARVIGKHYNQVANYVRGDDEPGILAMVALARERDVSLDWLLAGVGPKLRSDPGLKDELLAQVVSALERQLHERGLTLPPDKKGEAVVLLYRLFGETKPDTSQAEAHVGRVLRLVVG